MASYGKNFLGTKCNLIPKGKVILLCGILEVNAGGFLVVVIALQDSILTTSDIKLLAF